LFERYAFKSWLRDVEKRLERTENRAVELEGKFDLAGSPIASSGPVELDTADQKVRMIASAPTRALSQDTTDLQDAIERQYECVVDEVGLEKWLKKIESAALTVFVSPPRR
jgi:DNA polymerase-1